MKGSAMMTDREIVARYEELAAAADEPEIPYAEWGRRQRALIDFTNTSALHRRVLCDAYARKFPNGAPSKTPGLTKWQRQEMVDFVVMVNTAGDKLGLLGVWTIYGRPKNRPGGFIARRAMLGRTSQIMTRDTVESDLKDLRKTFRTAGMHRLERGNADRPHIIETWLA
jgi:hypothetical protein